MLRLPSALLPSALHTITLYVLLLSPTSATCSAHFILLVIFGGGYKWWSSSSCSFLQSPLSTLFSHTPSACSSLNVRDEISCGCGTADSYSCKCLDYCRSVAICWIGFRLQPPECSKWVSCRKTLWRFQLQL